MDNDARSPLSRDLYTILCARRRGACAAIRKEPQRKRAQLRGVVAGGDEDAVVVVADVAEAVELCNRFSPHFVASLVSSQPDEHESFYRSVEAPFVGDGFTRWVDGQFALLQPELGLSNWQGGRLFGRGGVLSGDSVYTVRLRATVHDPDLHR